MYTCMSLGLWQVIPQPRLRLQLHAAGKKFVSKNHHRLKFGVPVGWPRVIWRNFRGQFKKKMQDLAATNVVGILPSQSLWLLLKKLNPIPENQTRITTQKEHRCITEGLMRDAARYCGTLGPKVHQIWGGSVEWTDHNAAKFHRAATKCVQYSHCQNFLTPQREKVDQNSPISRNKCRLTNR